jgi:hypothetical protein
MTDFDDHSSIAYLSDADLADYLEAIGDLEGARALREPGTRAQSGGILGRAYRHAAHVYGFIEEGDPGSARIPIVPASSVPEDKSLVGTRIKVTLDAFRIESYPGLGMHTVLFDFQGRHQAGDEKQDLQYASVLTARDGDNAAVNGVPIFTGLGVPADGLAFKAKTISIGSDKDEAILRVLKSAAFKEGLQLMGAVQPALPQLVGLAGGIIDNLLNRFRNKPVQVFDLGLDFSRSRTSARLRKGSYVVAQVPDSTLWNWSDWFYDPSGMNIVDQNGVVAPVNAIIFAVSDSAGSKARSGTRTEGAEALKALRT